MSFIKIRMTLGTFILAIFVVIVISNNTYNMVVAIEARNLSAQHALNREVPKVAK